MDKVSDFINQLNDLKITANKWLDDNHPKDRKDIIEERVLKLYAMREVAIFCDEPFSTEENVLENVVSYIQDKGGTQEEAILEVGLYSLAWDELLNIENNNNG